MTEGTITDDCDVFLFGGRRVYRNFFNRDKHVELFTTDEIDRRVGEATSTFSCPLSSSSLSLLSRPPSFPSLPSSLPPSLPPSLPLSSPLSPPSSLPPQALSRDRLICLAYLLGGDYCEGLEGVGIVTAMELLSYFPGEKMEALEKLK